MLRSRRFVVSEPESRRCLCCLQSGRGAFCCPRVAPAVSRHPQYSHLLACDVLSGHFGPRLGRRGTILPAHAAAHRRGAQARVTGGLAYGWVTPILRPVRPAICSCRSLAIPPYASNPRSPDHLPGVRPHKGRGHANRCLPLYDCAGCGAVRRPKSGDCCVFCSCGTVPCRQSKPVIGADMSDAAERRIIPLLTGY